MSYQNRQKGIGRGGVVDERETNGMDQLTQQNLTEKSIKSKQQR
jgi:hypothetical protein